jgi:hypothetical protein
MLGFFIALSGLAFGSVLRDIILPKPKEIDMTS